MRGGFSIIRERWRAEPLASGLALVGLGFLAGAWWRRRSAPMPYERSAVWRATGQPPVYEEEVRGASWRPEPPGPGAERASVVGYQRAAPTPPAMSSQSGYSMGAEGPVLRKPDDPGNTNLH